MTSAAPALLPPPVSADPLTSAERTLVAVVGAGQAGLATAYHLQRAGLPFVVLERGAAATGSWARYYDSLELFSPARYSSLPGMPFPGDPRRYPKRDEVVEYLGSYARRFAFPIRYGHEVERIEKLGSDFVLVGRDGRVVVARAVVLASGSFSTPYVPSVPGAERFRGTAIHAIDYRRPEPWAGRRVVVVGAGNTAVQIAHELATVSEVTLATRGPVRYLPQRILGADIHWWLRWTGLDRSLLVSDNGTPVLDDGRYRRALAAGRPPQRAMFTRFTERGVVWDDGGEEQVDAVIFGTGYRPAAPCLAAIPGALDAQGHVAQRGGFSTADPRLACVGFSRQRTVASATLRGVGPDAAVVVRGLRRRLATATVAS